MLKFVTLNHDLNAPNGRADKKSVWAAEVPGGVLCYLRSVAPDARVTNPDGRSLTYIPGVQIDNGELTLLGSPRPEPPPPPPEPPVDIAKRTK